MRAFIAIDLPEEVRAALGRKQQEFRTLASGARWTRPEGIHVTLKFLGEIPPAQAEAVRTALAKIELGAPFTVEVKGFGFFPDARRPRVFWAGVEAPEALARLAAEVEKALEPLGFERESRAFRPHLTLARFNVPRPQPGIEELLERSGAPSLGRFEVRDFWLFESKLSPAGAVYVKIARFPG